MAENQFTSTIDTLFRGMDQFVSTVLMMEIGALMVGKIVNHHKAYTSIDVFRGQEKGYFAFGGSSILLLFQPHTVTIDRDIMRNTALDVETRVRMGEAIGQVMEAN